MDVWNETDYKSDSHDSSSSKLTVVKIENGHEETFDEFIIDYVNDSEVKKEAPTTSEQLNESVTVKATPEEILQVPNVKTKPPVTGKIPTCNKMEESGMYKEPCSGKKLTYKSSKSDPRGLFNFQVSKGVPFPVIFEVTKTQVTKLCSVNCAQERKVNHDRPNEQEGKAVTASAAFTRPMSVIVVKLDGTLSDPVFLHAKNGKESRDVVHNAVTNRPIRKDTVTSIQENGCSSFEDYGNMKKVKAREEPSKNKRTFSNSLVIPENYRSDPKRFSDVEVKLRRLDMCTDNTSNASCRNSLAAVPMTKPNTASDFNQLKSVEITTGLESLEGVEKELVDIIDVISEPVETEDFTDHTGILKQSRKGGLRRKLKRTTKRKLNAIENEVLNDIIEIISESAAKKGFAAESPGISKLNQHPEKSCMEDPADCSEVIAGAMENAGGTGLDSLDSDPSDVEEERVSDNESYKSSVASTTAATTAPAGPTIPPVTDPCQNETDKAACCARGQSESCSYTKCVSLNETITDPVEVCVKDVNTVCKSGTNNAQCQVVPATSTPTPTQPTDVCESYKSDTDCCIHSTDQNCTYIKCTGLDDNPHTVQNKRDVLPDNGDSNLSASSAIVPVQSTEQDVLKPCGSVAPQKSAENKTRPDRYCVFCKKVVHGGKLKRHISRKHKIETEVREILKQPKNIQNKFFNEKRREGIYEYNLKLINKKNGEPTMRERQPLYRDNVRLCSDCNGFFSNKCFFKHKCVNTNPQALKPKLLQNVEYDKMDADDEFTDLLNRFRDGEVGDLCRTNRTIKMIGYRHFNLCRHEEGKQNEVRKEIMAEMRELAKLYIKFQSVCGFERTVEEMFSRDYLTELAEFIKQLVRLENSDKQETHGQKLGIDAIILKSVKTLLGHYAQTKQDGKREEMKHFKAAYKHKAPELYPQARRTCIKNSLEKARRPDRLPSRMVIRHLWEYIAAEIKYIMKCYSMKYYVWLRSLVVARLTLFNARRGEEASRMLTREWELAKTGTWLPPDQVEKVNDPAEKYLIGKYKMAYLKGKGRKYVPVLVPLDLVEAINILSLNRGSFGIRVDNEFLFATKRGYSHCCGWHALDKVCKKAGIKLNATGIRHYLSSMYASLDMSGKDQEIFLQHMGHEKGINKENYQCPQGVRTVLVMDKMLSGINNDSQHTESCLRFISKTAGGNLMKLHRSDHHKEVNGRPDCEACGEACDAAIMEEYQEEKTKTAQSVLEPVQNNDCISDEYPCTSDSAQMDKEFYTAVPYQKQLRGNIKVFSIDGACAQIFPMFSTVCVFGRSRYCDIKVDQEGVLDHDCQIEINKDGEAFLVGYGRISNHLKHNEEFLVGRRKFIWEYPITEDVDSSEAEDNEVIIIQGANSYSSEVRNTAARIDTAASCQVSSSTNVEDLPSEKELGEVDDVGRDPAYVPDEDDWISDSESDSDDYSDIYPSLTEDASDINVRSVLQVVSRQSLRSEIEIAPSESDEMVVEPSSNMSSDAKLQPKGYPELGCKKKYDKMNWCTYCEKMIYSKITRHLLTHNDRVEILKIRMLPKRSEERAAEFSALVNEGNYKNNIKVLKSNKGTLLTMRRESPDKSHHSVEDYYPCEFCMGFCLKRLLWYHAKNCKVRKLRNGNDGNFLRNSRTLLYSALLENEDQAITPMFERMNDGEVKRIVAKDMVIKKLSAVQIAALGDTTIQKKNDMHRVGQNARTLGRLVLKARKEKPAVFLSALLKPENFDLVVRCVCDMSTQSVTLGPRIGHLIGHSIMTKSGWAIRSSDAKMLKEANGFKTLFDAEWKYEVNAACRKKKNACDVNKVTVIPETQDLVKLRNYLVEDMKDATDHLAQNPNAAVFHWLGKITLCRLLLFNKRRVAEVEDLTVEGFTKRPEWKDTEEFQKALTQTEKQLAKRMDMVESVGKSRKNQKAYVLITPETKRAVEVLIDCRKAVDVPEENKYLFARLNANTPLSGVTSLREVCKKCPDLLYPERITSTNLRKYVATVSQILDMTSNELRMLAKHMGHDVKTHKEYYQLSSATQELSKVSRMLTAVECGHINTWKDRPMSEIKLDELPYPESDEEGDNEGLEGEHEDDINGVLDVDDENPTEDVKYQTERNVLSATKRRRTLSDEEPDEEPPAKAFKHRNRTVDDEEDDDYYDNDDDNETYCRETANPPATKRGMKKRWTDIENHIFLKYFKEDIQLKKMPVASKLHKAKVELSNRTILQIRTKINNIILGKQKLVL